MFHIDISADILENFRSMLFDDESCVRIGEFKIGAGCNAKLVLGLGMDEMDEDEDEKIILDGIPFIAEKDFLLKYGVDFCVSKNESGGFAVSVKN